MTRRSRWWAFSEAAVRFVRKNALSILAAKLGRAVYHLLRRERTFDPERFFAMN